MKFYGKDIGDLKLRLEGLIKIKFFTSLLQKKEKKRGREKEREEKEKKRRRRNEKKKG